MQRAAREEEEQMFPFRVVECVKSPDGHVLKSNREMRAAFRAHIRDRFAHCPHSSFQEFRCYLTDFPRLQEAEVASCEGVVTECKFRDSLKQVGLSKSPWLDGLPFKV